MNLFAEAMSFLSAALTVSATLLAVGATITSVATDRPLSTASIVAAVSRVGYAFNATISAWIQGSPVPHAFHAMRARLTMT